ncbi:MAG: phosphatase PAP2 family protein [Thermoflexales bacterium]|nr:phosphatase PAP2 family protein [Thermoflexales bacterium]
MRAYVPFYLVVNYALFATAAALGVLQAAAVASGDDRLAAFVPPSRPRLGLAVAAVWTAGAYAVFWLFAPELLTPGPAGSELTALFGLSTLLALGLARLAAFMRVSDFRFRVSRLTPHVSPLTSHLSSLVSRVSRFAFRVSRFTPPVLRFISSRAVPAPRRGEGGACRGTFYVLFFLLIGLYDWPLFRALNGLTGRWPWLDGAIQFCMNDYIIPTGLVLTLVGLWFAAPSPAGRLADRSTVLRALAAMLLASLVVSLVNRVYFRPRPFTYHEVNLLFYHPSDSSFPSNAATVGFSLALAVWLRRKRWGAWMLALAAALGLARVCGGVHYPLDVLAGASLGGLAAWTLDRAGWMERAAAFTFHIIPSLSREVSGFKKPSFLPCTPPEEGKTRFLARSSYSLLPTPYSLLPSLICLLAFGLRVYRLGAQSLWYDEALSVWLASLPPAQTIATSAVTDHPPLHALLLGGGMGWAGRSEFAVRFLSTCFGVLAVALTYRAGRHWLGRGAGLAGALLLALSPFAVWYAQETRGYSLLLALTALQIANCKLHMSIRSWVLFVAVSVAALYTHYYAAFTLLALNVLFLMGFKFQVSRFELLAWLSSQLAILLAFLPWLPAAWDQAATNTTYFPGRVGWQTVAGDTLRAFTTGSVGDLPITAWAMGTFVALLVLGVLAGRARRERRVAAAILLLVPLVAMAILAWSKPKFAPRYVIAALPAFLLLVGAGLDRLYWGWRRLPRALTAVAWGAAWAAVLAVSVVGFRESCLAPASARPDARGVADYIARHERAGDIVVLVGGYQQPIFEYYAQVRSPLVGLPPGLLPPAQQPLDYRAAACLQERTEGYERAWLVLWQAELADPTGVVLGELLGHARRVGVGQGFHDMALLLFELGGHAAFGAGPQHPLEARFAQAIRLRGYDLDVSQVEAGQDVSLALYWQADGAVDHNYVVFVHVLGPDGEMLAQADRIAGADSFPTSLWQAGALVRNTFTLSLPPDARPGVYKIAVGLYNAQGRLPLAGGADHIVLAELVME